MVVVVVMEPQQTTYQDRRMVISSIPSRTGVLVVPVVVTEVV